MKNFLFIIAGFILGLIPGFIVYFLFRWVTLGYSQSENQVYQLIIIFFGLLSSSYVGYRISKKDPSKENKIVKVIISIVVTFLGASFGIILATVIYIGLLPDGIFGGDPYPSSFFRILLVLSSVLFGSGFCWLYIKKFK